MLLDEPFSVLDTELHTSTRKATADLLIEAEIASILVTHDQNEVLSFAVQVAVARQGCFAQVGTPLTVCLQPVDKETALSLGDVLILPTRLSPGRASCALGDPVTDALHPAGEGEVILRPGQLSVSVSGPQESITIIHDVDFSGRLSTLTLSMTGHERPIVLRTVGQPTWQPGAMMRLTVSGEARVFSS